MRTILCALYLFVCITASGQIKIDTDLQYKYDSILKAFALIKQSDINWIKKTDFVFYSQKLIDTLNKDAFNYPKPDIIISDTNGFVQPLDTTIFPFEDLNFCNLLCTRLDSLVIDIGIPFNPLSIEHTIYKNTLITKLQLRYKHDSILKKSTSDLYWKNELSIPTHVTRFALSDTLYQSDKTIYGEVYLATDTFWIKNYYYPYQDIQLRYNLKYLFRIQVRDEESL